MNCLFVGADSDTIVCRICKQTFRAKPNAKVFRSCRGVLDWRGRLLVRLKPGLGLSLVIRYSGAKAAAEWAAIIAKDCPRCKERQKWLDNQWHRFVWARFAYMPSDHQGQDRAAQTAETQPG